MEGWAAPTSPGNVYARLKTTTGANLVSSVILGVCAVILLICLGVQPPTLEPETACAGVSLVLNATACNTSNTCLMGFLDADTDQCTYYRQPLNASCTSACYKTNAPLCDGKGACVGDTCVGECTESSDCTGANDIFNDFDSHSYDSSTGWTFSDWSAPVGCALGRCTYIVMDIYAISNTHAIFVANPNMTHRWRAGAARFSCLDYVDNDIREARKDCLIAERFLLSPAMIRFFYFDDYGNETFPFQLSVCTITYSCGNANASSAASTTTQGVSVYEVPLQSMDQWGFLPTPDAPSAPGPLFGIQDPFVRNAFAGEMHDVVSANLPNYLQLLAEEIATAIASPNG